MARRHHRRYRGLVAANLGALGLNRSVGASDVAVGVAIGVVGAGAARWVENSVLPASWKAYLMQPSGFWAWIHANMAAVGAASAGLLAYFVETKVLKGKRVMRLFGGGSGYGHALGAIGVGVGIAGLSTLQNYVPAFRGLVRVNFGGSPYGFLVKDADSASFRGLITRDPGGGSRHLQGPSSESSNLAGLSRFTAARAWMMS